MFLFTNIKAKHDPPKYDEAVSQNMSASVVSKATQWKTALDRHKYEDVNTLVEYMIQRIDAYVKRGQFPRGFVLVDCSTEIQDLTVWKCQHEEMRSNDKREYVAQALKICLGDKTWEKCKNFLDHAKLDDAFLQRLKSKLEETGLLVNFHGVHEAVRIFKEDPSKEQLVTYLQVYIKLPD